MKIKTKEFFLQNPTSYTVKQFGSGIEGLRVFKKCNFGRFVCYKKIS
jgi:hypothetical protein